MRSPAPCRSAVSRSILLLAMLACAAPTAWAQTPESQTPQSQPADAPPAPARVQLAPLPDTEQFNRQIELRTRPAGESLDALIQVLARSVGLSAITQGIPAETLVRYDLGEPKPFREVWDIVLTLNGLEYVLREDDIVVVGPPEALAGLQPQQSNSQPNVTRTYTVSGNPLELKAYLESQFSGGSGVSVNAFEELGLLSVRASASQQARIARILSRFDRTAGTPVRRTYSLSYARAEALAEVLAQTVARSDADTTFTDTVAANTETAASGSGTASATGEASEGSGVSSGDSAAESTSVISTTDLTIAADTRTNQLIITAVEMTQREIAAVIKELDQPERQVNVQVRIQEVTSDVTERLGIDLTAAVGNFTTTLFSGDETSGLGFIFDAQRAISGFNLGAVLDAFERQGLSRRVDDSNITVLNNGEASLQAGGTIYISIPGGEQNIERTIPYGVQIDLNPQITNNDEVILSVTGKVDAVLSDTNDPGFLNLSTRNLTSRVSLKPGQTIVLGGLLQNQLTDTTRRVPGLGDVPVIGNLFSTNSVTDSSTELLVIVTANVLE
jgi:type II secretory pathway component GspD/PulD (secretin)